MHRGTETDKSIHTYDYTYAPSDMCTQQLSVSCNLYCITLYVLSALHLVKKSLRPCFMARGMSEICNSKNLWQWSQLEISFNNFQQLTITQKQFINSGFNCLIALEPLQENSKLFTVKSVRVLGTHLIDLRRMTSWVNDWYKVFSLQSRSAVSFFSKLTDNFSQICADLIQ